MTTRKLRKIGLAVISDGRLLVVRKRGTSKFILPGGKPEKHEEDLDTLNREVSEELGCAVRLPLFEGEFTDVASELSDTVVTIRLYSGQLLGTAQAASEIEELVWIDLSGPSDTPLAPSLINKILPHLRKSHCMEYGTLRDDSRSPATTQRIKGALEHL
jgi:8-oxo-dGTP diphosphatase